MSRLGIIGCGRMGRERAQRLRTLGTHISSVYDVQAERAEALAKELPECSVARTAADVPWRELDAIFLCTPPAMRVEFVQRAADAGVAIFAEKPIGRDAAEALEMAAIVGNAGVCNAVGYMNRYRESIAVARNALRANPPVGIIAYWTCGAYSVPWWSAPELSGGPFNEQATHAVDLVRYLGGEIEDARGYASPDGNRAGVSMVLGNGAFANLLYSCEGKEKFIGFDVITRSGRLRLSGWDFDLVENTIDGRVVVSQESPFALETEAFLDAVRTGSGERVACTFDEAAKTQRAVDDIRISCAQALEGWPA